MKDIEWTVRMKIVFFLALLSFLHGFLFFNVFSAVSGSALLLFLVYTKFLFEQEIKPIHLNRTVLESILYVNHPFHVKTSVQSLADNVYLEINEQVPSVARVTDGETKHKFKTGSSKQTIHSYQLIFDQRGRHKFPPVQVTVQDALKLYSLSTTIPVDTSVLVHSDPREIQKAKRASTLQDDTLTIPSVSGLEEQVEFEGIRSYQPGDSLRHIDWKASSRLQHLVSKTFERKENVETVLFLDLSQSMRRSMGSFSKLDHAIAVTVQLATILQKQHHPVGFVAFDEYKVLKRLPVSFEYQPIFTACANLPSAKLTESYLPQFHNNTSNMNSKSESDELSFLSKISPFISQTRRQITHHLQTTGVYQAVTPFLTGSKKSHFVFITDLETNQESIVKMITKAHHLHHSQWILTLFSPFYHQQKQNNDIVTDVEEIYQIQQQRQKMLHQLRKKHVEIIDLTPDQQAIHVMKTMRGKKK